MCRWKKVTADLQEHQKKLAAALEVHSFNRDVDDINERINEKVCTCLLSFPPSNPSHFSTPKAIEVPFTIILPKISDSVLGI